MSSPAKGGDATMIVVGQTVWVVIQSVVLDNASDLGDIDGSRFVGDTDSLSNVSSNFYNQQGHGHLANNNSVTWQPLQVTAYNLLVTRLVPAIFTIIIVMSAVGNGAVICVITRRKEMRTPVNIFLLNLAVSDVMFTSVALPVSTYRYATTTWQAGEFLCRFHIYVIHTAIYVSVYTMAAIAVYRCFTVTKGNLIAQQGTLRTASVTIATIWAIMLTANSPLLFLHHVKVYNDNYAYCAVDRGKELYSVFFVCAYLLPISIAVICYSILICHIRRSQHHHPQVAILKTLHVRNVKVTRLLIIVLLTFALCWLPVHIQLLTAYYGYQSIDFANELFRMLSCCLGNSTTVVNPFLYNFALPEFRASFRSLLGGAPCWMKNRLSRDGVAA
jgi:hypothetical protein